LNERRVQHDYVTIQIPLALVLALSASLASAKPLADAKAYAESYGYSFNPLVDISRGKANPFLATPANQVLILAISTF
jgi:hypothetical protein